MIIVKKDGCQSKVHLNCTTDLNNRCIQSCKIMDKQPKIFIDEIVRVINDDKHIFDALQNHVLACSILMVDELYPNEVCRDIEDEQIAYNNCRIDFDTPGVEDYIVDSCIYDFDGWTCGQYVDYNWCCINNCNNLPNWTDSQGMTCDDYESNNIMCTEEQKQNPCTADNIENYYNDPINADCCGAELIYNAYKLPSKQICWKTCCALGGGIRTNEEHSISSKPTYDMTCNDNKFPIEGGYCMKEQLGRLRRVTEIDGNNITSEEQCIQYNGQWINENFSGNYPDKDFCKDECQNNINNCNVNANHAPFNSWYRLL